MRCLGGLLLLAAGVWAGLLAKPVLAQQTQADKSSPKGAAVLYDQYEPHRVRRGRSQPCLRDEEEIGAWCVKRCEPGYLMVPKSDPARCRGIEPLPPGQIPGPMIRWERGKAHKPPPPQQAAPGE